MHISTFKTILRLKQAVVLIGVQKSLIQRTTVLRLLNLISFILNLGAIFWCKPTHEPV